MESGDTPDLGGNVAGDSDQGTPIHLSSHGHFSKDELRASMRAFLRTGRTRKETSDALYRFCCAETGSWIRPDNDNKAAPPPSPCADSFGMSTSSSRSSQNPSTQPQTPTLEHNPSLALQYGLDHRQQPQDDYVGLRTFLRRLLAPPTRARMHDIQALFDKSCLPGHGTPQGFDHLVREVVREAPKVGPALVEGPNMASLHHIRTGSQGVQQHMPSIQAPSSSQSQYRPTSGYQQSSSGQHFSYNFPHIPNLGLASQQHGAQLQHYHMSQSFGQDHTSSQQSLAPINHPKVDSSPAVLFNSGQLSLRQDANNAASPPTQASPPNNHRQPPRQKHNDPASTAQASPAPPKNAPPKDAKKEKEVSQKAVVHCKLLNKDGKECTKSCSSEDSKNAEGNACKFLIEHIHRVHPDHYIANLPSNRKSLNDMFNVQIARCTAPLANGKPCDWQSTSDKPWREGIDHIKDHHPQNYSAKLTPPNKAHFDAMVRGDEVVSCLLKDAKDNKEDCPKACFGDQAYRSLVEHVRRGHCDKDDWKPYYVSTIRKSHPHLASGTSLKSCRETLEVVSQMFVDKQMPRAPAMELSMSNSSMSSGHSLENGLPKLLDAPLVNMLAPVDPSHQQVQNFGPEALQYDPNAPHCLAPAMLQMSQMDQMGQLNQMGFHQQQSHATLYEPQLSSEPTMTPLGFPSNSGIRDHRQQVNMGVAMQGAVPNSNSRSALDPTLGQSLFPAYDDGTTGPQQHGQIVYAQLVALQQSQSNAYQQPQNNAYQQQDRIDYGGHAAQAMANSTPPLTPDALAGFASRAEPSSKKRGREEMNGVEGDSQELPSKRASDWSQYALPATSAPFPAPVYAMASHMSQNAFALGADSHTSDTSDTQIFFPFQDQSGISAPPVDSVGSGEGLPAFDYTHCGVASDGGLGGDEGFDDLVDGSLCG